MVLNTHDPSQIFYTKLIEFYHLLFDLNNSLAVSLPVVSALKAKTPSTSTPAPRATLRPCWFLMHGLWSEQEVCRLGTQIRESAKMIKNVELEVGQKY